MTTFNDFGSFFLFAVNTVGANMTAVQNVPTAILIAQKKLNFILPNSWSLSEIITIFAVLVIVTVFGRV